MVESLEIRTMLSAAPWLELPVHDSPPGLDVARNRVPDHVDLPEIIDPQEPDFLLDPPAAAGSEGGKAMAGQAPLADTFLLHSNPPANHTIYLDFDGHITEGTTWNSNYGVPTIDSPAYDPSGDGASFNTSELERIQRIWQRVAEDFAPFNVNVTTEDPGTEDLRKSGTGDQKWGTRVVVTDDTFANCGCGGHAFIGSFNDSQDEPVFVYNQSEIGVSAASTHEVGHALYLSHDGQGGSTYYNGHGSGETGWGPIMGSGYYKNMTTWDNGEYYNTTNSGSGANYGRGADDLHVITTYNGFGYLTDDHGGTRPEATALDVLGPNASDPSLLDVEGFGIIGNPNDLDYFSFTTAAGTVDLTIDSYYSRSHTSNGDGTYSVGYESTPFNDQGSNLDVLAELYDSSGTLIASSNPTGLSASFTNLSLGAGTYFVSVDGTGYGDWTTNPPTGYTDYVSLGQFLVTGTVVQVISDPPTANDDTATTDEDTEVTIDVLANDTDPDLDPLSVASVTQGANGSVAINADDTVAYTPDADFNGSDSFTYTASDGLGGTDTATVTVTVSPVTDISIAPLDAEKAEGDSSTTPFTFTVTLDTAATGMVTANWSVAGSGASPVDAADFGGSFPSGTITFPTGEDSQTVTIDVTGDIDVENDEGFTVSLSNPTGGVTIAIDSASGTIQNDDIPPVYQYVDLAGSEATTFGTVSGSLVDTYQADGVSESVTEERYQKNRRSRLEQQWTFNITGGDIDVSFHVKAGHDSSAETFACEYDAQDGLGWQSLVTLSSTAVSSYTAPLPTSLSGEILVRVVDTNRSPRENVTDTVTIDHMYILSERSSALPPAVSILAADSSASEADQDTGEFVVELTDGEVLENDLTVYYAVGGSASADDYREPLTGSVVISAGQLSVSMPITPIDDDLEEGTESIILTLSSDTAYRLGAAETATVNIADDDLLVFVAQSETNVSGLVSGTYVDTHNDDGVSQVLTEAIPKNKKSDLEHRWTFDLTGETTVDFQLEADRSGSDADVFQFQYSTDDGITWLDLVTVTQTSPSLQDTQLTLPSGVGTVVVRVIDTDNSRDNNAATLSIDLMCFRRTVATAPDAAASDPASNAPELEGLIVDVRVMSLDDQRARWASLVDAFMADDEDVFFFDQL